MPTFLDLPPEIRTKIYHHCFGSGLAGARSIKRDLTYRFVKSPFDIIRPLLISRLIYEEASREFYKQNALCLLHIQGFNFPKASFSRYFTCTSYLPQTHFSRFVLSIQLREVTESGVKTLFREPRSEKIIFMAKDLWKFLVVLIWCIRKSARMSLDLSPSVSQYWKESIIEAAELVGSPPIATQGAIQPNFNDYFSADEKVRVLKAFWDNRPIDVLCHYLLQHVKKEAPFEALALCQAVHSILSQHAVLTWIDGTFAWPFPDLVKYAKLSLEEAAVICHNKISESVSSSPEWIYVAIQFADWCKGYHPGALYPEWKSGRGYNR